ncbi:MAG: pantoate--beta-alanine ligase [Gemmatimonadales bacterium]
MIEISDLAAMRSWSRDARSRGVRVGLVPTMGFLHEGHLRLVDRATAVADGIVLSIFVNPLQFGPGEDLDTYPRDLARDREAACGRGVECLFVPDAANMYPRNPEVRVVAGVLAEHLCGAGRPGHFDGVLTVVAKLFHIVEPDVALFGRKDIQQAQIIKRMVSDLNFPTEIIVAPTVRDSDRVALSSRNAYLSKRERETARRIPHGLQAAHELFVSGVTDAGRLVEQVRATLTAGDDLELEYVEIVDPATLAPVNEVLPDAILALAARVGRARLIDNMIVAEGLGADVLVNG